jgi:hypothetical protein
MQDDSNIKILKEHMISFLHEGVQVTTTVLNTLPNFDAMYNFKVIFYGNQKSFKKFKTHSVESKQMYIRVESVYKWLKMLKSINPYYFSIIINDSKEDLEKKESFSETLFENAELIEDKDIRAMNNITTDDISNVRVNLNDDNLDTYDFEVSKCAEVLIFNEKKDNIKLSDNEGVTHRVREIAGTFFPMVNIFREENPINEFLDNKTIFALGFPYLFLFGKKTLENIKEGTFPQK